ncbi:MAG: hypothetical protein ACJ8AX_16930, partial [Gemmatimonadales bacterium]
MTTSTMARLFAVLLLVSATEPQPGAAQGPILELDHAYVVVPAGAAAAVRALRHVGIVIDTETVRHEGEGTTS